MNSALRAFVVVVLLLGVAVMARAPGIIAQSGYDALVNAQTAVDAAGKAVAVAERAKTAVDKLDAKADASHERAVEARRTAEETRKAADAANDKAKEAHDAWKAARGSKDSEPRFDAWQAKEEEAKAAAKAAANKDRTAREADQEAYEDGNKAFAAEPESYAARDAAEKAVQKAQQATDAVRNQPGKKKELQQKLDDIKQRAQLALAARRSAGGSTVASGTAPGQTTATLVGVVLPVETTPGKPVTGRLVTDLDRYRDVPALRLVTIGQIPLPRDTTGQATLEGIVVETPDGRSQRADEPLTFIVPDESLIRLSVDRERGTAPHTTVEVPLDRKVPIVSPATTAPNPPAAPDYSTQPVCIGDKVQSIRGPLTGDSRNTSVTVDDHPAKIVAETPEAVYYLLPGDTSPGSHELRLQVNRVSASFPICVLQLLMRADRLELLKGQSTAFQAVVSGPEKLPADAWQHAGVPSDLVDVASLGKLASEFKIPRPGERATLLFRIENMSRGTVSIRPNDVVVKTLEQRDFTKGPYPFAGTIQSARSGGFRVSGLVVAFFAPVRGTVSAPPVQSANAPPGTRAEPVSLDIRVNVDADRLRDAAAKFREIAKQKAEKAVTEPDPAKKTVLADDAGKWEQMAADSEQKAREQEVFQNDAAVLKARQAVEEASKDHKKALDEWQQARADSETLAESGIDFGRSGPEGEAARNAAEQRRAEQRRVLGDKIRNLKATEAAYQTAVKGRNDAEQAALKKAFPKR